LPQDSAADVSVQLFAGPNCTGNPVGAPVTRSNAGYDHWELLSDKLVALGAQSARFTLEASRVGNDPARTLRVHFDGAFFRPGDCDAWSNDLCLLGGRFRVHADYAAPKQDLNGAYGVRFSDQSGKFWFFDRNNVEVDVKILDGCGFNHRYWLFAAGLTN